MARQREITVRMSKLADQGTENDLAELTPGQRIGLIHQPTIDAWAMKGSDIAEQRLQRHVVRIKRRGR